MAWYRKGLWGRTARWQEKTRAGARIFRTASGVWVVTTPDLARQVLVEDTPTYPVKPAFLRVDQVRPLPPAMRAATTRRLLHLLSAAPQAMDPGAAAQLLAARPCPRFQSWGIWFMRELYRPVLSAHRSPAVDDIVDHFVESLLVDAMTRGDRLTPAGKVFASLQQRLAAEFSVRPDIPARTDEDLLDTVARLRPALTASECAEVYLRLVTALLGATGVALEWTVAMTAVHPPTGHLAAGQLRRAVLETQRLRPSSWRIYRESSRDHTLGGRHIRAGDHVIVASSVIHRDPRWWPDAESFLPDRWRGAPQPPQGTYLPFSDGPGACPARGPAVEAIRRGAAAIFDRYAVTPRFTPGSGPRALAVLAPPMGELRLAARQPDSCPAGRSP
ncbi:MAG TPA: cytochrome P450 [Micromonosporaceae bacterium]|nr:cytochrome P450 [Micromonosporaceae bacterium]